MKTKRFHDLCYVVKVRGGKRALWQAFMHDKNVYLTGAGNTADNAINDLRKQFKLRG